MKQFDLAEKYNKLVTIHCVYEWEKLYKAIENNKNKENLVQESKIILHSFQGNCKIMEKFKNFNPWFSISPGCFIEKNFDMIRKIPIENLLLESDSPSMFNNLIYDDENKFSFYFKEENGKFKNHPMSIIDLGSKIAELKEIPIKYFFEQIQKNSKRILKMIKIH